MTAGSLYTAFSNIHRSRNSSIWLLYGWCRVKLLPSRRMFCVHHTTMHQFTASTYSKPLALLPGLEVATFLSRVQRSGYQGAILAPVYNFARFARPPAGPLSHFCLLGTLLSSYNQAAVAQVKDPRVVKNRRIMRYVSWLLLKGRKGAV